ncbi:MAG: transglutaminase family protein, partial [Betaproteobacteria bacterium]
HFGQGKWYPGEPLPRWALGIHWRTDGKPLWRDPKLFADTSKPGSLSLADSERFIQGLVAALGLDPAFVITAYEDAPALLREEAALPENVDPMQADLTRSDERARLARLLMKGIDKAAGYLLPIRAVSVVSAVSAARDEKEKPAPVPSAWRSGGWESSPWPLRRERLYLVAGDSPLGLRLPLDSLPWVQPDKVEVEHDPDPFAERPPLADPDVASVATRAPVKAKPAKVAAAAVIKTALCAQVRNGHLYVFMPPLKVLEDYVELLSTVERVAAQLTTPLVIEGYTPPRDPRAKVLNVTPDPGVIEVNVHPASSWAEVVNITQVLYEEARQSRLATEKFMLDGRHTGTGGGNHVTLGGATPADSPLLRRPDLLRSLLTYWQNHPGLSYLFCGQFIGPTSQAPRVDEARDDRLYELEIAFQQLAQKTKIGEENLPWLTDRLLRHLLTDLTGNTHRSEFSIDKLYSPDGPTGRLGLLEFRGFEMPPHWQMSLAQILLLRTLVARFWKTPCTSPLTPWGTQLHDRWMLPHFIHADIAQVIRELRSDGYAFDTAWFAPFLEFRFPRYGTVEYDGISIELRQAIEPWHVLGEEMAGSGTARYVDSSVERLQVKVTGMQGNRHALACNRRLIPLTATGAPGEFVAGVRFRAWSPPSALHPTIGVQVPLVFDLVDTANRRSLGGCVYHVSHPGGRNYATFPVNANEAEARRQARFAAQGHTAGVVDYAVEARNPSYPATLDLRWQPA